MLKFNDLNKGDILFWNNVAHGKMIVKCLKKEENNVRFKLIKHLIVKMPITPNAEGEWGNFDTEFFDQCNFEMVKLGNSKITKVLYGVNK